MRSTSWLSLLGFSMTLWLGTADDSGATVGLVALHGLATDAAGVAPPEGREHGQGVQVDARFERHRPGSTQYPGGSTVTEAEAGDAGEEPLRIIRPRAVEAVSLDGFSEAVDQAIHLIATTNDEMVGVVVRPDGTLGREEVRDGGVVEHTEGSLAALQENQMKTVEIDNRGTVRPHLAVSASEDDVLVRLPSEWSAMSKPQPPLTPGGAVVTIPVSQPGPMTAANPIRSGFPPVTLLAHAGPAILAVGPALVAVGPAFDIPAPQAMPALASVSATSMARTASSGMTYPAWAAISAVEQAHAAAVPVIASATTAGTAPAPTAQGVTSVPAAQAVSVVIPGAQAVSPTVAPPSAGAATEVPLGATVTATTAPTDSTNFDVILSCLIILVLTFILFGICVLVFLFFKFHKDVRKPSVPESQTPPIGTRSEPVKQYRPLGRILTTEQRRTRMGSIARAQVVVERWHNSPRSSDGGRSPTAAKPDLGADASAGAPIGADVTAPGRSLVDSPDINEPDPASDSGISPEVAIDRNRQQATN